MDNIFQKLIDNNFSDLAGLTVDASIPVPEHIVNEFIGMALQGNKNISYCFVSINSQNKVSVSLKTPLWLWSIHLKLRLENSVDFTGSPKLKASLENNVLLGKLGALFKALPAGININGNQILVDIRSFLDTPEQRKLLDLIKSIEVRTEIAKVIFEVKIKIEQE
jgi:hypothetical protein